MNYTIDQYFTHMSGFCINKSAAATVLNAKFWFLNSTNPIERSEGISNPFAIDMVHVQKASYWTLRMDRLVILFIGHTHQSTFDGLYNGFSADKPLNGCFFDT